MSPLQKLLGVKSQFIIPVSAEDFLTIIDVLYPSQLRVDRFLISEYYYLHTFLKKKGKVKFIQDYIESLSHLEDWQHILTSLAHSNFVNSDLIDELKSQIKTESVRNDRLYRLLCKHGTIGFSMDYRNFFNELVTTARSDCEHFNFSAHSSFYWDALALEYIFDFEGIYHLSPHDLFELELTPSFPKDWQQFVTPQGSYSIKLPMVYESVDNWEYAILGTQTFYQVQRQRVFEDIQLYDDCGCQGLDIAPVNSSLLTIDENTEVATSTTSTAINQTEIFLPNSYTGNWQSLQSDELRQCRTSGAASEKLRRCLIAIVHFNDYTAKTLSEKWAINQTSLQRLSGCNRDAVKQFLAENSLLVSQHNSQHGLTERHNTGKGRAGISIEQVISW